MLVGKYSAQESHRYCDLDTRIRALLTAALHGDPKSIRTIADELSAKVDRVITPGQLRAFCAESKSSARFPLLLLPALLAILEDGRGLRRFALGTDDERLFQLGEAAAEILSGVAQRKLVAKNRRKK